MSYKIEEKGTGHPSDESLMQAAQDGDGRAFETLVRRYDKRLYNYIRRIVRDPVESEDLFQETFLRVHRHLHRFDTGASFRPWVYRIATNLCRDFLRARSRRPHVSIDATSSTGGAALGDRLEAGTAGPRAVAGEHELTERLDKAVAMLPVKQRAVFLMARYDQMSYDAIAKTLHIPVGTVKSRMNKAVHTLLAEIRETAT